jgi:hypothetical protein
MARVFGITASTPSTAEQLLGVEVTHQLADQRVSEALGGLVEKMLPNLAPGASLSVLFRRGDDAAEPPQPTSHASVAINNADLRQSWDFTVAPYNIEPEEVPL